MSYSNTAVIIPTLNEEKNIGRLIDVLNGLYKGIKIFVVDDGSIDKTKDVVRNKKVKLIDRSKEKIKGLTISVIDGIKLVNRENVIVMDADFQHPPEVVGDIIKALEHNDIVVASRKGLPENWPLSRKIISFIAISIGRVRLLMEKCRIKDVASGYFGVKTQLMKKVLAKSGNKFEGEGYKILFDLLKYYPKDTKISEVYYRFGLRERGSSKMNKKHLMIYFKSLFKTI